MNQINWQTIPLSKGYCDSDFTGDKDTRVSVTGFCVSVLGYLVSWKSQCQKSVTLSSTEVEYVAVSEMCAELLFIQMILEFLGRKVEYPIIVRCGNVRAIFLAHNAKTSHQTKHINTRYYFVPEYVESGVIKIVFVRTSENLSDPYTKNVSKMIYNKNVQVYQE